MNKCNAVVYVLTLEILKLPQAVILPARFHTLSISLMINTQLRD